MACLLMDKRPAIAEIAGRFIFQEHVNYGIVRCFRFVVSF
jgi:hypothetical protein